MCSKSSSQNPPIKIISENRKAKFNYQILDTLEAGIVLTGAEIKSIRQGGISLQEGYVRPTNGEAWLLGVHIKEYAFSKEKDYDPVRARKLLLKKDEIRKLIGKVEQKGLTLIPLKVYLKSGRAKVEIALAKGKAGPDKREDIKKRESSREVARVMKRGR